MDRKKGLQGEEQIYTELKNFSYPQYKDRIYGNYDVKISDVYEDPIPSEFIYQSDFILVANCVIFVIEVKNWAGKVSVDNEGNCIAGDGEYRGNPFTQNDRHVSDLRKFIIDIFNSDIEICPAVVFCKGAHVNVAGKYKNKLINFDNLNCFITEKIAECENKEKFDAKVISSFLSMYGKDEYPYDKELNIDLLKAYNFYKKQIGLAKEAKLAKEKVQAEEANEAKELKKAKRFQSSNKYNVEFDNSKRGFQIQGLKKADTECKHKYSRFLAVAYNNLLRNNSIDTKTMLPQYLLNVSKYSKENIELREIYHHIYKLMIVVLLMIRNNQVLDYSNPKIQVDFLYENKNADIILKFALEVLNDYLLKLSKLSFGEPKIEILYPKNSDVTIGYQSNCHIYISDSNFISGEGNEIWIENNIQYNINETNADDLLGFAKELSNFDSFREGQFECLANILTFPSDKIIIMPTGSGKSFIYYLAAFLQPKITVVISPTELLIENQIMNLKNIHAVNNLQFIKSDFKNFNELKQAQILYMTPETLQNDDIIRESFDYNTKKAIYSFVLDEVHCLSYRSHNFRPEYFTLPFKLKEFFTSSLYLGFTATSDYKVTKELMEHLKINEENILNPISINANKIKFEFFGCDSDNHMFAKLLEIVNNFSRKKTIIFVKNESIGKAIWSKLDPSVSLLFNKDDYSSLELFSDISTKFYFLVATIDIGIGIDIKNIKNVIHFGIPFSKMDFLQQVGRAGREGNYCDSYVIFLQKETIDSRLITLKLDYKTFFSEVIKSEPNDYIHTYNSLFNKFYEVTTNNQIFDYLVAGILNSYNKKEKTLIIKKLDNEMPLFVLYKLGIVEYWGLSNDELRICISKEIRLDSAKKIFRMFLDDIDSNELNREITDIKYIAELAKSFYNAFIDNYVKTKKDQMFKMLEMLEKHVDEFNISGEIKKDLENFFALPFVSLFNIETEILDSSFERINVMISEKKFSDEMIAKIERIYNPNPKFNYIALVGNLKDKSITNTFKDRFSEIINVLDEDKKEDFAMDFANILKERVSNNERLDSIIFDTIDLFRNHFDYPILYKVVNKYISISSNENTSYGLMLLYFNEYFESLKGEIINEQ